MEVSRSNRAVRVDEKKFQSYDTTKMNKKSKFLFRLNSNARMPFADSISWPSKTYYSALKFACFVHINFVFVRKLHALTKLLITIMKRFKKMTSSLDV